MKWEVIYKKFLNLLDKLISIKYGFYICSVFLFVLIYQYGRFLEQNTIPEIIVFSAFYALGITWYIFMARKYGWKKATEKIIEKSLKLVVRIIEIIIYPLIFVTKPINWLFFKKIPKILPPVFGPLYRFIWFVLIACLAYFLCWKLYSINPDPKDFGSINIKDKSYPVVIVGAEWVGLIMFFGLLDFIPSYIGMFFGWLGKFKWKIQFVLHW
jgi:hypothetical protein